MSRDGALVELTGATKDYPKLSSSGDRLRTLGALLFRRQELPHFRALDHVDLRVMRGESVGIIGENGAGKSTLLKLIAGVVRPSSGEVRVEGRVSALLELGSGFHPEYTGRENIYLSSALMGLSRAEARAKVASIIEFADIGPHIDEPIKHYSSGMVVRLGFAVATALDPELLITDEVLAVGDESFQKKCIAWIESYLAAGGTLLLVSHSMFHVQTLCRKALWLQHGRSRMYGGAFDVTREYLAYHEDKRRVDPDLPRALDPRMPRIEEVWTESATGEAQAVFAKGDTLVIQGRAYGPEDRPPVVLVGIVRLDGTPVFGSLTNEGGFEPARTQASRFAFAVRFNRLALLPGKYHVRAHALDPQGLRLFDTVEAQFTVTGETRDFGLVELEHSWHAGRGEPLERAT